MVFKEILEEKRFTIGPELDKLVDLAIKNQTSDGDLLLVKVNGHYDSNANDWVIEPKMSPYMIGLSMDGHSHFLHYDFISQYINNAISKLSYSEYLELIKYSPERREEIENLIDVEGYSIQLEMLIYLKVWEGDFFIKKLYQIVRLAMSEPYDWHFRLSESNRDKNSTGTRDRVIREFVRDRIKEVLPTLYDVLRNTYISQIRNSIAHSKYAFLNRGIGLNNYIKNDAASQLKSIKFDQWIHIFHNTVVLYNEMIRIENEINGMYMDAARSNNNFFTIRISMKDPIEKVEYHNLKLRPEYQDWNWAQNEK